MGKEEILICICAVLFVISLYYTTQNVKLTRRVKDLLSIQILLKSRLDIAETSRPNIVTVRCSKIISKRKIYDLDSDMPLEVARREILKEFSEELGNYVTWHMYDDKTYASIELVGFLRVIKEENMEVKNEQERQI